MAHHKEDHSEHDSHNSHGASHHSHGDSHDSHGDSHGSHHHETRHYTDQERNLYGFPKNTWNECTDHMLDFHTCVKSHAKNGFPFKFVWSVNWADRWTCAHENHAYKECLTQRMLRIFEENKDEIAARQ